MYVQVDVAEERLVGCVAEGDVGHLDDWWREFFDFREFEVHSVPAFWGFENGHFFKFLYSRLGFRGFGGVVTEFVDKGLEMSALSHLIFVLAFGGFAALFFCCVEGVKVGALVVVEAFGVLVDYVCCYFVEEGSVVRDYQECRWV